MNQPFQIRNIFSASPAGGSKKPAAPPNPPAILPPRPLPSSLFLLPSSFFHILNWLIVGGPPKIRLAAGELDKKRRRLALSVGIILLIILVVSGIFGLYRRREIVRQSRLASFSQRTDWIISQADQLSAISPARAGEMIRDEQLSLEAALANTGDKKLKFSLAQIISVLDDAERRVSRVETVTPELYLSLGLVRPDTSGRRLSASQNSLGILSDDGTVLLVSMSGRSGEVVAGGDLIKNAVDLSVSTAKVFVLNPDNIIQIDVKNKTSAVAVTDEDDAWADPVKLSAFGGSLFVLDKSASEIYKFSAVEAGGYGSQRRWFAPGISPNLSDVIDMAIDGDVWLLHQDGRLDRYRRGAPAGFKQSGLPDELVSPQAISVPQDGSRVFILDNSARVVAFDKESGEYAGQWQFAGVDAIGLAVSQESGKIFLLAGEKIYSFDLK